MVTPSLRQPTRGAVHAIVRRCRLPPESAETLRQALAALVPEIEAEMAVPEAERRARRRKKVSALAAFAAVSRQVVDVFGPGRPAGAAAPSGVLGRDIGLLGSDIGVLFSSNAFPLLLGLAVIPRPSRAKRLYVATGLAGVEWRQKPASSDCRVLAVVKRLAEGVEAELEAARANTLGRPADHARRVALVRLLQLHERLTGRPAPSWPSEAFRDFAASCFAAIGLPTEGLDPAVERLFGRIRRSRKAST